MLTAILGMGENGDGELTKQKPFHDFLGMVGSDSRGGDASSGLYPSNSDLGSERQKAMCLEGVPFHGLRRDVSGHHMTSKTVGSKRSNSYHANMGHNGFDRLHSVKTYRAGSDGEQPRRLNNEEILYGSKALQPSSISQALPHQTLNKTDGYSAKRGQPVTMNVPRRGQYPSYISPFVHQVRPKTFRDAAAGPSVISHAAADEGSRNGIQGSGIQKTLKSSFGFDEIHPNYGGQLSGACVTGWNSKSGAHLPESEAPIPGDRQTKSPSSNRQMTIFYDGHAHVFDDVHQNKADVIMALAASWSSTLSAKSSRRLINEGPTATGETENGTASNANLARDQQVNPPLQANPS